MQIFRPFQDTKRRCWLREHGFSLTLSINPIICHRVSWLEQGHQELAVILLSHMAKVKKMHFPVLGLQAAHLPSPSPPPSLFQAVILQKHIL